MLFLFFFFNDSSATEIYTLSLHDALPISIESGRMAFLRLKNRGDAPHGEVTSKKSGHRWVVVPAIGAALALWSRSEEPRLNSSHPSISYAVFCLKKKIKPPHSTSLLAKCT